MARAAVRGVELAFTVTGQGPTFVYGHGLSGSRASDEEFGLLEWTQLERRCQVLRYDARGHGSSGFTPDPSAYSWEELARDQLALLDAVGVERYIAAGASMGCGTALHAALLAPSRVEAMVLLIPPTAWETRRERVEIWEQLAVLIEDQGSEALIAVMQAMPKPSPLIGRGEWDDLFASTARRTDPIRLAGVFRGAGTADLPAPDRIAQIEVPTLILAWDGDPGHPVSTAEQLNDLLPRAELEIARTWKELRSWTDRTVAFLEQL